MINQKNDAVQVFNLAQGAWVDTAVLAMIRGITSHNNLIPIPSNITLVTASEIKNNIELRTLLTLLITESISDSIYKSLFYTISDTNIDANGGGTLRGELLTNVTVYQIFESYSRELLDALNIVNISEDNSWSYFYFIMARAIVDLVKLQKEGKLRHIRLSPMAEGIRLGIENEVV